MLLMGSWKRVHCRCEGLNIVPVPTFTFPPRTHISLFSLSPFPRFSLHIYILRRATTWKTYGAALIFPVIHLPFQNKRNQTHTHKTFIWCFDAHKSLQHIFLICIIRLRQRQRQQRLRLQTVLNYKKVIESWATGITSCYDNLRSLFHLFSLLRARTLRRRRVQWSHKYRITQTRARRTEQEAGSREQGQVESGRLRMAGWMSCCLDLLSVCLALELPVKRLQLNNSWAKEEG